MSANVNLIATVLDAIANEPDRWDQQSWVDQSQEPCGTTMCFAGHALIKSGKFVLGTKANVHTTYDPWTNKVITDVQKDTYFWDIEAGKWLDGSVSDIARDLLGLSDHAQSAIFMRTAGPATRNPDAFRAFVVSVLLSEGLVDGNEAASLLDVEATRSYSVGFDEDFGYSDDEEAPF